MPSYSFIYKAWDGVSFDQSKAINMTKGNYNNGPMNGAISASLRSSDSPRFNLTFRGDYGCREVLIGEYRKLSMPLHVFNETHNRQTTLKTEVILHADSSIGTEQISRLCKFWNNRVANSLREYIKFEPLIGDMVIKTNGMIVSGTIVSLALLMMASSSVYNRITADTSVADACKLIIGCQYGTINYADHIATAFYLWQTMVSFSSYMMQFGMASDGSGNGPAKGAYYHMVYNYDAYRSFLENVYEAINLSYFKDEGVKRTAIGILTNSFLDAYKKRAEEVARVKEQMKQEQEAREAKMREAREERARLAQENINASASTTTSEYTATIRRATATIASRQNRTGG